MEDKDLAVAVGARADADDGHGHLAAQATGQPGLDALRDDGEGAGLGERPGVGEDRVAVRLRHAAPAVARGMDPLGQEADVAHHRDAGIHEAGDGRGIVWLRGQGGRYTYPQPPTFHDDRIRHMADGQLFNTISNGVRNMPAYAAQIAPRDRWAIVSYVRALQISQATGGTP